MRQVHQPAGRCMQATKPMHVVHACVNLSSVFLAANGTCLRLRQGEQAENSNCDHQTAPHCVVFVRQAHWQESNAGGVQGRSSCPVAPTCPTSQTLPSLANSRDSWLFFEVKQRVGDLARSITQLNRILTVSTGCINMCTFVQSRPITVSQYLHYNSNLHQFHA